MSVPNRVPIQEVITDREWIAEYDRLGRAVIGPVYKYFVWKLRRRGLRRGRVLDLGSGPGFLLKELARSRNTDFRIVGLDISPRMAVLARRNIEGYEDRIDLQIGAAARLPFKDHSFDAVVSNNSLHHWAEPVKVLKEINRVARPGALCIIRDNRRASGTPWWRAFVWLSAKSLRMTRRQVDAWATATLASYTATEIRQLLSESELKGWKVRTDLMRFQHSIENS